MTPVYLLAAAMVLCSVVLTNASPAQRTLQSKYPGLQKSSNNEIDQQEAGSDVGTSGTFGGPDESSHDGSRIQFHMQGHKGPKSYRFGYDTGHGKHRQFRYEERDEHGVVHGRYGFRDKHGHMRVIHYTAHPHDGYHASEANPKHYSHYR